MAKREHEKIEGRQREGVAATKDKESGFWRSKKVITEEFEEVYREWTKAMITVVEAMRRVGMKHNTFYRKVADVKAKETTLL